MPTPAENLAELKAVYKGRLNFKKPFAIGIRKALLAERRLPTTRIRSALELHCSSKNYLHKIVNCDHRYGLDGVSAGPVSPEDKQHAKTQLALRLKKKRKKAPKPKPSPTGDRAAPPVKPAIIVKKRRSFTIPAPELEKCAQ